jgi:hypothetical protein
VLHPRLARLGEEVLAPAAPPDERAARASASAQSAIARASTAMPRAAASTGRRYVETREWCYGSGVRPGIDHRVPLRAAPPAVASIACVLAGCAASTAGARVDEATTHPSAPPIAPFTECTVYTAREPTLSRSHVTPCDALDFPAHPPATGDHFGQWAAFRTYASPVPWGFLVHSLEHGAVVVAYRCDTACPTLVSELQAIVAERVDPACRMEATPSRMILVPDPDLEWPIAVVAWEHVYLATCLDPPSIRAFVDAHYDRAPESFCFPGVDLEGAGWCP